MNDKLERLRFLDRERNLVARIGAVLGWDQETYMPSAGVAERAEQLAMIEGLAHEKGTLPEIGELLAALGSTDSNPAGDEALAPLDRAYLRTLHRGYTRAVKIPKALVEELARAGSLAQAAWAEARQKSEFKAFAPHLSKMLELRLRVAACIDPAKKPYDVFLDDFEPGSSEESIAKVFGELRTELVALLGKIRSRPQVDDAPIHRHCPEAAQVALSEWVLDELSFPRDRARLDKSAHPFTTTLGADDVRITSRYHEDFFVSSLFSAMHECGHALYELGMAPSPEYARTSLADSASFGIHESQSRMWENVVGRSEAFWKSRWPKLQATLGETLRGVSVEDFVRAVNKVEPSLIRVEADEVTYGLHIILRFEIESALVSGRLKVEDVPAAWNAKCKELLGIEPANDGEGCLQDVHWSFGGFGYFPSYSLGNLYAAQFWNAMRKDIPGLDASVASKAGLEAILAWLRNNIHSKAATLLPDELVLAVTGESLSARHFVKYLEEKYGRVYGF
ncbi:MAG: carboxypeptidase M32 [Spirochaetales bacterium]|nr:carboxypeptidase M32 [Spirochaetales bacterium]